MSLSLTRIAGALAAAAATSALASATGNAHHFNLLSRPANFPVPTPQQLKYGGTINMLIHFNQATFFHDGDPGCTRENWLGCDPNGGCNSSNPLSFNPTNLNVSSWIEAMQSIGATSAVLTAKHGCGFLLWKPKTTLPDGSPYTHAVNDSLPVFQLFAEACQAAGIGYGAYYSLTNNFYLNTLGHNVQPPSTLLPGQVAVTQQQYEDLSISLMHELWTQFGNFTEVWLDGGCGSLCDRVSQLLNQTLAANAVAFNGGGGTSANPVRWCGTEGGNPQKGPGGAVWSTAACGWCPPGSGPGDAPNVTNAAWNPSGVDVTIQQGDHWFYTPGDAVHPLGDLIGFYHQSVGSNGHLEIDLAVDRTGGVDPVHMAAYKQFGAWIRSCYGTPLASGSIPAGSTSVIITLPGGSSGTKVDRVRMKEDQTTGQNVVTYVVEYQAPGSSSWQPFSAGTTIGATRIDVLPGGPVTASSIRLTITSAFSSTLPVTLEAFAPAGCAVN